MEIKRETRKYDLVVVDNPAPIYGGHCEHFELFPDLFKVFKDKAIIILNVISSVSKAEKAKEPELFNDFHLEKRRQFYQTTTPLNIEFDFLFKTYERLFYANGFVVDWCFFEKRTSVHYLVMAIQRDNEIAGALGKA